MHYLSICWINKVEMSQLALQMELPISNSKFKVRKVRGISRENKLGACASDRGKQSRQPRVLFSVNVSYATCENGI